MSQFTCTILRIIDADTFEVRIQQQIQIVRLQNIDCEESKIVSLGKPLTSAGVAAKNFALNYWLGFEFNAVLEFECEPGSTIQDCLRLFPDYFGRILCNLYRSDGDFYNYRLIQEGWSPYFTKYGYSHFHHSKFQSVENYARGMKFGIWGDINLGGLSRNYSELIPWWNQRAESIEVFRSIDSRDFRALFRGKVFDGSCDNLCNFLKGDFLGVMGGATAAPGDRSKKIDDGGAFYLVFFVDFSAKAFKKFHKGHIYRCGSERAPLNLWIANRNLCGFAESLAGDSQSNFAYVRGYLHKRRGYMQVEVLEICSSTLDFQSIPRSLNSSRLQRETAMSEVRRKVREGILRRKTKPPE